MAQRALYRRMARSGLADLQNEAARRVVFNVGTTLKHSRSQYDFSKQVGLRAEWERFDADADVDFLSLGIVVGF